MTRCKPLCAAFVVFCVAFCVALGAGTVLADGADPAARAATPQGAVAGAGAPSSVPPAAFTDAARRQKLATAFPRIDALVADFAKRTNQPGAVLGVVIDGELVHVATHGVQDLESKRPVTADSVFRIASMSKSFTAMAILRLRDEGKLSLDDPAERYLPELRALAPATADAPAITIRHLLTHSAGFPEDNPWGDRQLAQSDAWMGEALRAGLPFSTTPGTAFEYSNYGFAMLGRIVQQVAGKPYAQYMREAIFAPLGMAATTFEAGDVPEDRLVQGYRIVDGEHQAEDLLPHGAFGAMGGLWTSANDLARYVAFLMSAFPPSDRAEAGPIRRASAREMQQVWRFTPASARRSSMDADLALNAGGYGYGLRISQDCRYDHIVGHGGGLPGYGSLMQWLPEYGVGLIAMANTTYTGWGGVFRDALTALEATGGLERRRVQPSPALLDAQAQVTRLVTAWDDALAKQLAADNLFLDQPIERRREAVARLNERHGACRKAGPIDAENALRGSWRIDCERGWLQVGITLAPTMPPRVQMLSVRGVMPPQPPLQSAIDTVVASIGTWNREALAAIVSPQVDLEKVERQAALARLQYGACKPGETMVGDGTRALFELSCEHGTLWGDVVLDTASGKVRFINLMPDLSVRCAK